jgi:hypothetical protein
MKLKLILLLFILFIGAYNVQAQEVVMTKEKHEQLRKNIEDYKTLIKVHKALQTKTDAVSKENEANKLRVKELELQLAECKAKPVKKKNIFQRFGAAVKRTFGKVTHRKNKQDW